MYLGFADRWTETGGYFEGILATSAQLVDYLNRFAELGIEEIVIVPLENLARLDAFLDRFAREVRPNLS